MKDNITVSVSSIHGTKHFSFGKKTRHTFKFISAMIFFGILLAAGIIYYLLNDAEFSKLKLRELENKSSSLSKEITSLTALKISLEQDLSEREERMQLVSDRLGDLESLLGMDNNDGKLESRLDTATINSSIRVAMLTQIPSGPPVKNARTSSGYGKRIHPVTGVMKYHRGQDFAVNTGTPIYAPADGAIEAIRPSNKGSGNFLRILHSYGFSSSYSHLSKFVVKKGDFIKKGDLIAYSGNSGLTSGPHLHYEVRFIGRPLNPKPFLDWNVDKFDTIFKNVRGIRWESLVDKIELRVSHQLQLSSQKAAQLTDTSK
ncbi:M23 family metallopeptidase [Marinomonas primoryensis]|mgnify:FL=1|jgi:murein DD-endopeptidase MepM/ murein hydrolase activator NlpD|uniref:M23 family metallopeptidase n=1 Tax=Marinomonas primoryensis TaxID=178399 RepID=A0A859CWN2_9GAMM|nr:M23 family metallopeptidase [Marinomonas primoryensis]QKK80552.1 M23 family metallopeptidase [Marinomonas primoryensis]|tara:strand:- start:331 stop:1278 length:948 start_codon:yes stop_codon:yes gene_type:complete